MSCMKETFALMLLFALWSGQFVSAQTHIVLHSFAGGTDGSGPYGSLILDSRGNLYGTTLSGGAYGYGTVFKVTPTGVEKILYSFKGYPDGESPFAGLVADANGNAYGTTQSGGRFGYGTVFEITSKGREKILYSFGLEQDGGAPYSALIMDKQGNLYGTTAFGGSYYGGECSGTGCGTVFKLSTSGVEEVLHSFEGTDGDSPLAGVIMDGQGNLYGTTAVGGNQGCQGGCGTAFQLRTSGALRVFEFRDDEGGFIPFAGLVRDAAGNFYGTTSRTVQNWGTAFKLTKSGKYEVLHTFTSRADGATPSGDLLLGDNGNLYGTTSYGGNNCSQYSGGCGTVFQLTPDGAEKILHSFAGGADGAFPEAGLVRDSAGNLYGTTGSGGTFNFGTVFKIIP
ncbi:MAG: hypothetical protein LAO09_15075 [Acidobacteriia bacterium]|nr:hypothetical protein [Terriglobia bacterium]